MDYYCSTLRFHYIVAMSTSSIVAFQCPKLTIALDVALNSNMINSHNYGIFGRFSIMREKRPIKNTELSLSEVTTQFKK